MRRSRWTLLLALALPILTALIVLNVPNVLHADDDADETAAKRAAAKKTAAEELVKSVKRGEALWSSKTLGRKTCKSCHDNPDKPKLDMATRAWSYPAWSRRQKKVITLQQKVQEMIKFQCRGKALDQDAQQLADLGAYMNSVRKK